MGEGYMAGDAVQQHPDLSREMGEQKGPTGNVFTDMTLMHQRYGFHPSQGNHKLDVDQVKARLDFIREELDETYLAFFEASPANFIDGLIDIVVVAVGTLDLLGINGEGAWKEVYNRNIQKEVGSNPSRPNTKGMDLIKPKGWKPPELAPFISDLLLQVMTIPPGRLPQFQTKFDNDISADVHQKDRYPVEVFERCIEMFRKKSSDYVFPGSTVQAADYYPRGIDDVLYMVDVTKRLRMLSILDKVRAGITPEFEGLEDTLMDRIIYLAIGLEFITGNMQGQEPGRDIFNREVTDGAASDDPGRPTS